MQIPDSDSLSDDAHAVPGTTFQNLSPLLEKQKSLEPSYSLISMN